MVLGLYSLGNYLQIIGTGQSEDGLNQGGIMGVVGGIGYKRTIYRYMRNSLCSRANRKSRSIVSRACAAACMVGSKKHIGLRPDVLARYIAVSACCSKLNGVSFSCGNMTTPILAEL